VISSNKFPPGTRVKADFGTGRVLTGTVCSKEQATRFESNSADKLYLVNSVWITWDDDGKPATASERQLKVLGSRRNLPAWW
jgi:hypothetical protein